MKPLLPAPGTRIRLRSSCVWPERRGHPGVVVAPPADGTYPQPAKYEVLVLLDDDPLPTDRARGWSCVLSHADVEVAA